MTDPQEVESAQVSTDAAVEAPAPDAQKKQVRPRKPKAQKKTAALKDSAKPLPEAASVPAARGKRKIYSEKERAQKLSQIEKAIGRGESSKSAVAQAGISEQTYYQWKKSATPAAESGDLKDLLALEEENKRLKSLLAERLRKENAELKKKLGLA